MKRKIPATIVTGFLGAGKTTLVRHLIKNAGGRRLALIVNEFGDVGVDGELLAACGDRACGEDDIIELANGCLCCTVADAFLPTMTALIERDHPPEHIIIETSGLAIPKPLIQAFNWPDIRSRVTVDGVVTVVDGPAVAAGRFADDPERLALAAQADQVLDHDNPLEEVFEDQLLAADLVLLNKIDLMDPAGLAQVLEVVGRAARGGVRVVPVAGAKADPVAVLGLSAAAEDDLAARPSHHDAEGEHDHDDFESFVVDLDPVSDPAGLEMAVTDAIIAHDILRLKGFLAVPDRDARLVIQAVGPRIERYFDRPWRADEARASRLVVIGRRGLDRAAITLRLKG